ncbi:hypothetical protein SAMN04487948_101486 [Halogranum amylolyticum]|uniref:Lipoprotein n=1 Tax=Halogranum amylolyticum TaxID=660520 RepID=A0A1H8NDL3_9EURY|nr:hypothetical protein [Halogranum amylolyticum]SEO27811.1 hypothetical protein SAMN04487948_101486 [Halogranum amylolyticum]
MPSQPTRRALLATCGAMTASLTGCLSDLSVSSLAGDEESTGNASNAAGDADGTASATVQTARPTHCMAVTIDSYLDPQNDDSGRESLVVEVDLNVSDPPTLSGEIVSCEGTESVSRQLADGGGRFEFGPYEADCVERYDFWLEGCRDGSNAEN